MLDGYSRRVDAPDILIEKPDGWPIVLEAEVGNHRQAEVEAQSRLGNRMVASTATVHAALALVYSEELRHHHGAALRNALRGTQFEYALFTVEADGSTSRFPEEGWISGDIAQLAVLLHRSSIPAWRVEVLADALERGVVRAEGSFSATHPHGSVLGQSVADLLGQNDDEARSNASYGHDCCRRRTCIPRRAIRGGDGSSWESSQVR